MKQHFFKDAPHVGFTLISSETDKMGMTHYRYRQMSGNVPLKFGTWMVHALGEQVVSMNGKLYDQVPAFASAPMSDEQALTKALDYIGAAVYLWENEADEEAIKIMTGDPEASYYPTGELYGIAPYDQLSSESLVLTWRFNVYAAEPLSRQWIYVDANSGDIVQTTNLIHHTDSNGTAETGYSGLQEIMTDYSGSQFRLRESGRGDGIHTFNMNNQTSGSGVDFFHPDNHWDTNTIQIFGTDAHWGAEMTYDFYANHFNRNSIDNNGFTLISRVHYGTNYGNAFWDGSQMTYGDGSNGNTPFTALDVAGHEITHGLTTFTANLIYQAESGALNESFSDIFAAAIERDALGVNSGEWLIGEDLNFLIRNMSDPNALGDPDTYFGTYWASLTGGDNGGVHTNSGVQNFWFYLLSEGGTGVNDNNDSYDVVSIGIEDAAAVAYRNLTYYLDESSQYSDARFYAIQSAVDLFGACTQQVESTWNAWYAVGVGGAYDGNVDADFSADMTEHCASPATVNFTNFSFLSTNALWDFGDGNTSTSWDPSHTYQSDGEYTVTLLSSSNCGADTIIQVDYIKIGPDYPCQVLMPANGGLGTTQTTCAGILYDNGGPTGAYTANYNGTMTIAPTGAVSVSLEFLEFSVEAATGCIYDYMIVYDGPSTGSPAIGTYCNTVPPPSVINSTGNAITIQFSSDEGLEEDGFKIAWQCNIPSESPIADFEADKEETCSGLINFTDLSVLGSNVATSWYWDFGDGNSDTLQHPSHQYNADGIYSVTMVASNAIGSDTLVKANYINVDLPDAPTGEDDEVCPGESGTLIATSGGTHYWYDGPFSTNLLHVGDTFVTPIVQQSTAFWVESEVASTPVSNGPLNNQIGSGGYVDLYQSIIFDVFSEFRLQSVKVFASIPGTRNIVVYDEQQNTVFDTLIYIPTGEQVVPLNWDFAPGTNYSMTVGSAGIIKMWRNNGGVSYPYEVPGIVNIHTSTAGGGYYYYFYDWQVQTVCVSGRSSIAASTGDCTGIEEESAGSSAKLFPNPSDGSITLSWDDSKQLDRIDVYSATGKLVYQHLVSTENGNVNLDLRHLSSGVYVVKGSGNALQFTKRLIIE
jgi:bacillolysin